MKGKTIIELTDINTGEVKRIEDTNMFTNALDNIFNKAPYYLGNPALGDSYQPSNVPLAPIAGNALGGLLLFPEQIEEDEDIVYAPGDNKPVGIASFDAYSGTDSRRGSLDEILTKPITGGYQFVWNFSATRANGTISCIGLTSKKGGSGYFDEGDNLYQDKFKGTVPVAGNTFRLSEDSNYINLGADDSGIYFYKTSGLIVKFPMPLNKITLTSELKINSAVDIGTCSPNGTKALVGNEIWCIRTDGNSSGNATINIDKYSISTWNKTTVSMTVSAPLKASSTSHSTCKVGNYIYMVGYNGLDVYKIDLTNAANVVKIENAFTSSSIGNSKSFVPFNNGVICKECYIASDDTVYQYGLGSYPVAVIDNWLLNAGFYYGTYVATTVLTPYLATINNVTPFTKLATQNMTVTYIVTES